ncbi:hypothetical protein LINPERHAP2_LOCUS36206 [Linum perenne]
MNPQPDESRPYKKVHLQLDSLVAVIALLGNQEEDSRHSRTLETINELRQRNWEATISHIFREGNRVANLLAHHGHTLDFGCHVNCNYPMRLIELFGTTMWGLVFPDLFR